MEDLIQQSWVACSDAIKYFDPQKGTFLTAFDYCLKQQFGKLIGVRSTKRDAMFYAFFSLDSPINEDEADGSTFGDMTPDPLSNVPFEALENESEQKYIRSILDTVAGEVLNKKQQEEYNEMLMGLCCKKVAENKRLTPQRVSQRRKQMLEVLRGDPRILQLWLDLIESRESVGDIAFRYASSAGVKKFNETGASSVEHAVEQIFRNEKDRQANAVILENVLEKKLHSAWVMTMEAERKRKIQQMRDELAAFEQRRASCQSFPADTKKNAPLL